MMTAMFAPTPMIAPVSPGTPESHFDLETYWPVEELTARGYYFYQKEILEYLPDCWVRVAGFGDMIMLGSYSYLDLNRHPAIERAASDALRRYGTGTLGARLLAGTLDIHRALEARISRLKGTEAAALFSSGYMANVSAIGCLVGRHDTVICDKLDHASIVDGCQLSQAKLQRFRHNDMDHLEQLLAGCDRAHKRLVIVDGVYSMDGDIANLPEISRLCRQHGAWLMVDEAHSFGVLGETGRGIEEHFGLPSDTVDVKMGTLSKAIPSSGAYIAGSARLIRYLAHQARGFIYSGALTPIAVASALAALSLLEAEPERVRRLRRNTEFFTQQLRANGLSFMNSTTPIIPIVCGSNDRAHLLANYCQHRGVYVQAIPHPVVPEGKARLRVSISAGHRREDLNHCVAVLASGAREIDGIMAAS